MEGEAGAVRLMLLDPHLLFRDCLSMALEESGRFEIVGRADCGPEALRCLAARSADVLLVGANGLGDSVLDLTCQAKRLFPALRILILGRADGIDLARECLEAGADGFLIQDQTLEELRCAIEGVVRGEVICSPRVAHALFSRLGELGRERRRRERLEALDLTVRELEILQYIADGLSNQEIASRICLSVHTVKNHVHRILETLAVHNRWSAVRLGMAKGWLQERRRGEPGED
jgi:DNA-binding NarL/FixJ family response regulator